MVVCLPSKITKTENSQQLFFKEKGYLIVPSFLSPGFVKELLDLIKSRLCQCAKDLSCSYEEYLTIASRWVDPSPVTIGIQQHVLSPLKQLLEPLVQDSCDLVKLNIISKTPFSPARLPFHQDISYSPHSPYQFSAWIALTDVPLESGPLEIIAGSHKGVIEPAVDFWVPNHKNVGLKKKGLRQKLPVQSGDLIFFDSCLWHGSGANKSSNERFALVTRWKTKSFIKPFIPSFQPRSFGMWTCQTETEDILTRALKLFFKERALNYQDLLSQWEKRVGYLSLIKNVEKAQKDLRYVRLLHQAHEQHNGGDAQGILYKRLWDSFLNPLSLSMKHIE